MHEGFDHVADDISYAAATGGTELGCRGYSLAQRLDNPTWTSECQGLVNPLVKCNRVYRSMHMILKINVTLVVPPGFLIMLMHGQDILRLFLP